MNVVETLPLQRMRVLVTATFFVVLSIYAGVAILISSTSWWQPVMLFPSMVFGLWSAARWDKPTSDKAIVMALMIGEVTWVLSALFAVSPVGSFGITVTGAVLVSKLNKRLGPAVIVLVVAVLCTGLLSLIWHNNQALAYLVVPTVFCGVIVFVFVLNRIAWQLFTELDATRRSETELAIMKERFRFASDLHDIQGHTLHVVKLKVTLAHKIIRNDPATAKTELGQVRHLIAETISQTHSLAYGQRKLTISGELENAKNLFEAAGLNVIVTNEGTPSQQFEDLLSLVLREATTNILRHSLATQVHILVSPSEISISNDGCAPGSNLTLHGLADLQQRVSQAGGKLIAEQNHETFLTAASFNRVHARHE